MQLFFFKEIEITSGEAIKISWLYTLTTMIGLSRQKKAFTKMKARN
jgi:hypothetical protein